MLHSFTAAGVTICDQHAGEPAAPAPAAVGHRREDGPDQPPRFYRHDAPTRVTELFHGRAPRGAGPGETQARGYESSLAYAAALGIPESRFLE